jgi:DeoR family fructose operon transcriptional repressor
MVRAAQKVVVLADSSKVGREHLFRFASLDQLDVLVTDGDLDETAQKDLTARDLEVVLA